MIHQQNKPFENRNKCNTHDNARDKIGWADKSSKMFNSLVHLSIMFPYFTTFGGSRHKLH